MKKKIALAVVGLTTAALALSACGGGTQDTDGDIPQVQPTTSASPVSSPSGSATPTPTSTGAASVIDVTALLNSELDKGKSTAINTTVGKTFEITFTPSANKKDGFTLLQDDMALSTLDPAKSDPAKGVLVYTAKKAGKTRIGVALTDPDGKPTSDYAVWVVTIK